ncbi:56_t:CDS:2, partial [Gigaspora rosea]
ENSEDLPLSCLFSTLVGTYNETKQLSECETKDSQKIQNANTNNVRARIKLFEPYFAKLNAFQDILENYIICEKHYNQIFVKDTYLNYLKSGSSSYPRKRSCNFNTLNLNYAQIEPSMTIDIGIQVEIDNPNSDFLMQINNLKNSLNILATDYSKQAQVIEVKNNKIVELEHECEYLKKQITDLNIRLKSSDLYKSQVELPTLTLINQESSAQQKVLSKNINQTIAFKSKEELISVINLILILLPESQRSKYTNLKNNNKAALLTILQEIWSLTCTEEAVDEENVDKEIVNEEIG